ncbi:MAG TPA: hypothetical protein VGG56_05970 [Terracidiphilus sp.]|jgi:hypothetical protein
MAEYSTQNTELTGLLKFRGATLCTVGGYKLDTPVKTTYRNPISNDPCWPNADGKTAQSLRRLGLLADLPAKRP